MAAPKTGDRVEQTTSTTGTSNLSLDATIPDGRQSIVAAASDGATVLYLVEDGNGTDWEIGANTITAGSPDVLTRSDAGVRASTNGGNRISLSGSTPHRVTLVVDKAFLEILAHLDQAQKFTAAQRASVTTLTDGATITPNFADSNHFQVTLGGNRTLGNPTNQVAGQSGSIRIQQDGTGSRTLSFASDWVTAGGTAPDLSTAANAIDRLDYWVAASGEIHYALAQGIA